MTETLQKITLLPSAVRTTSGNGDDANTPGNGPAVFYLNVSAAGGTTPTLDVVIEAKDELSGEYFEIATFAQKTAVGKERITLADLPDAVIRAKHTIAGAGGETFTFSVAAVVETRG